MRWFELSANHYSLESLSNPDEQQPEDNIGLISPKIISFQLFICISVLWCSDLGTAGGINIEFGMR